MGIENPHTNKENSNRVTKSDMDTEWNIEIIVEMVEIIKICVFNGHQNKLIENIIVGFFLKKQQYFIHALLEISWKWITQEKQISILTLKCLKTLCNTTLSAADIAFATINK